MQHIQNTVKKLLRNTFIIADRIFDVRKILQNFFDLAANFLYSVCRSLFFGRSTVEEMLQLLQHETLIS